MSRYARTIIVVLSLFTVSTAVAAEYSDLYVIPIAGHARGAFGTAWRSDIVLHNHQMVPITVEMALIESGRPAAAEVAAVSFGAETTLHLAAGETRVVSDVLVQMGRDVTGALIVGASMPFVLSSRTYAERPAGRTLGQTVLPIAITGGADAVNEIAVLAGLDRKDGQRVNVGLFVTASRVPLVAEIKLVSPTGTHLGSQLIVLDAEGFAHRQFSVATIAGESEDVSAIVNILEGDGIVVPYASIVDNRSAEAIFVPADAATSRGGAAHVMLSRAVTRDAESQ